MGVFVLPVAQLNKKRMTPTGNAILEFQEYRLKKRKLNSDNWRQNFIIFEVMVTVKVGKKLIKAIGHVFNFKISDACSV